MEGSSISTGDAEAALPRVVGDAVTLAKDWEIHVQVQQSILENPRNSKKLKNQVFAYLRKN